MTALTSLRPCETNANKHAHHAPDSHTRMAVDQLDAAALIELANERSEQAHEIFAQFDADQSGYLGFRELGQALRALFKQAGLKKTPDFATLEEQFGTADTDGDNKVSPEEFVAWYNHAVEWTRRLQAEAEAEAAAKRSERPALLGQSALSQTSTQMLFELKMYGQGKQATPRHSHGSEAEASSQQRLKEVLDIDSLPSLSEGENRRVRDLFMRAVTEADKATATPSAKSGQMSHRNYETQQASSATARMGMKAYGIWAALAYGAGSAGTDGKSQDWLRERAYAVHCSRAAEPYGELSLQGMLLLLRPALRGSLAQAAASAYALYDLDNSGLISKVCRYACIRICTRSSNRMHKV